MTSARNPFEPKKEIGAYIVLGYPVLVSTKGVRWWRYPNSNGSCSIEKRAHNIHSIFSYLSRLSESRVAECLEVSIILTSSLPDLRKGNFNLNVTQPSCGCIEGFRYADPKKETVLRIMDKIVRQPGRSEKGFVKATRYVARYCCEQRGGNADLHTDENLHLLVRSQSPDGKGLL
jgi:hypothetical protein